MNKTAQRLWAVSLGVCVTSIPVLATYTALAETEPPEYPTTALPKSDARAKLDPKLLDVVPAPEPAAPQPLRTTRTTTRTTRTNSREIGFNLKTKKVTNSPVSRTPRTLVKQEIESGNPGLGPLNRKKDPVVKLRRVVRVGKRFVSPQSRTVLGTDNRVLITATTTYPWRALTKLYMTFPNRQVFVCSGTLIAAKYVLTAGHCIHNAAAGGWATRVEVIPGLRGSYKPYGSAFATYFRSYSGWTSSQDSNYDMALVTLDRTIGNTTGWLGYSYFSVINGVTGYLAGYPADKGGLNLYYHAGAVATSTAQRVFYPIDTYGGQSGSGVFRNYTPPGGSLGRYVFAVHTNGGTTLNSGTRIDAAKFNNLRSWVASGF